MVLEYRIVRKQRKDEVDISVLIILIREYVARRYVDVWVFRYVRIMKRNRNKSLHLQNRNNSTINQGGVIADGEELIIRNYLKELSTLKK